MRDYAKFVKRGYGRTNHLASIDIRHDRLTRDAGLVLEAEYDGKRPASMEWFRKRYRRSPRLSSIRFSREHQVHPWKFDPKVVVTGKPVPDMASWDSTEVDRSVGPPKDNEGI